MEAYPKTRLSKKLTSMSKYLAWVLRHKAVDFGLTIEPNGFVQLDEILNLPQSKKYKLTIDSIKEIISSDIKGRYEWQNRPPYFIRAVQGHSIPIVSNDETLSPITNIFNYPIVVHGTNRAAWSFIEKTGLNKMARNAVHFSIGYMNDNHVKSGMRNSCEVFVEINAVFAYYSGLPFYLSRNNVVLCPGIDGVIPPKYFKKVSDKEGKLLWKSVYDVIVYFNKDENKLKVYWNKVELYSEELLPLDNYENLNKIGKLLIDKEYVKYPLIIVLNKANEDSYRKNIEDAIEKHLLEYPSIFYEYYSFDNGLLSVVELINQGEITSGGIKTWQINWDKFYTYLSHFDTSQQGQLISNSDKIIKNVEDKQIQKKSTEEVLTKEILICQNTIKYYILTYLHQEVDIVFSIDTIFFASNQPNIVLKQFTDSFTSKPQKQGFIDYLSHLKENIISLDILNKRLVLCIRKSHRDILIHNLSKYSCWIPNLFQRNIIWINETDDISHDKPGISKFHWLYLASEEAISSLNLWI